MIWENYARQVTISLKCYSLGKFPPGLQTSQLRYFVSEQDSIKLSLAYSLSTKLIKLKKCEIMQRRILTQREYVKIKGLKREIQKLAWILMLMSSVF